MLDAKPSQSEPKSPLESQVMTDGETLRIAYLASEYPAVSHTFILREVRRPTESGPRGARRWSATRARSVLWNQRPQRVVALLYPLGRMDRGDYCACQPALSQRRPGPFSRVPGALFVRCLAAADVGGPGDG